MKPTRVLHLIDSFDLGGAQEVILTIARFAGGDFLHEAASLHGRGIFFERLRTEGVPVHSLSPSKFLPVYVPRLGRLLAARRFDVVHCHLAASNILGKPLARLAGVPVIINHDHANDTARRNGRLLVAAETWANRFTSHAIAVSSTCRDFLVQREHLDPESVTVVPNGIDTGRFAPTAFEKSDARHQLGLPAQGPLVAGVGRLNPQKNFHLFLDVAASLRQTFPAVHFVLAGSGPEEPSLRQHARELGLADSVSFLGCVADTRLVYAAADALLMPSRFEGLPMTLLEAMAMETPVVASRLDGIAEVVADGTDGLLVRSDDSRGFHDALGRILTGDFPEMGRAARRKVVAHHDAEGMTRTIEGIYRRLAP